MICSLAHKTRIARAIYFYFLCRRPSANLNSKFLWDSDLESLLETFWLKRAHVCASAAGWLACAADGCSDNAEKRHINCLIIEIQNVAISLIFAPSRAHMGDIFYYELCDAWPGSHAFHVALTNRECQIAFSHPLLLAKVALDCSDPTAFVQYLRKLLLLNSPISGRGTSSHLTLS